MSGIALQKWIVQEVGERSGKIEQVATAYLATHVGGDMWRLHGLIDQLIAYTLGKPIQRSDVVLFLEEKVDDSIFNLVDAIVAKNPKTVFAMIQEQYRIGKDTGYIFGMILRQFRILLELRDSMERDDTSQSSALAQKLGLHPFVVKKSLPFVKRYTRAELESVYAELLDIDIKTKTGLGDQSLLLDVFLGRLMQPTH